MREDGHRGRTYYELLGVTRAAPSEIITAVWRAWMSTLRAHPDLGGDEELAKALNAAYETLKDPKRRAAYDAELSSLLSEADEATRRAPRVKVDAEIAYCAKPEEGWITARVVDASALGMRIRAPRVLGMGQNVALALPGRISHACEARVRWIRTCDKLGQDWRCEAGLEFFSPIPDILRRLGHKRP